MTHEWIEKWLSCVNDVYYLIPTNYFRVKCMRFSSCYVRNFWTFPTTFQRLHNVVKNVRRCSDDLFNDDILVRCDKVKHLFGSFSGILNLTFIINVLKNNSSGFVSQAWEIVFDAWNRCLKSAGMRLTHNGRESWQVYYLAIWMSTNSYMFNTTWHG